MESVRRRTAGAPIAGRYAIERPLDVQGDGPVYRAIDLHLQRRVTLRVLPTNGWEPGVREQFETHVRKATSLDHPHLAGIRDFGTDEALRSSYIVYEPHDGITLAMYMAQRDVPDGAALEMVRDLAEGVGAAHWAGLVHGEIHPGTIFLAYNTADRRVRAMLLAPGLPLTGRDASASPARRYAAPETLAGAQPTPASDVFSLGILAHELLGGLPKWWDLAVSGEMRREDVGVPLISSVRSEIPQDAAEGLAEAIRDEPGERFNDGAAFGIVMAHATDVVAAGPGIAALSDGMPNFLHDELPAIQVDAAVPAPRNTAPAPTPGQAEPASAATDDAVDAPAPAARPAAAAPQPQPRRERKRSRVPATVAAVVAGLAIAGATYASGFLVSAPPPVTERPEASSRQEDAAPGTEADAVREAEAIAAAGEAAVPEPVDSAADGGAAAVEEGVDSAGPDPAGSDREVIVIVAPAPTEVAPLDLGNAAGPADVGDFELSPVPMPGADGGPAATSGPVGVAVAGDRPTGPNAVHGLGNVDERPTLLNMPRLQRELDRIADTRGRASQGSVLVRFVVLPTGRVDTARIEVVDASTRILRDAARSVIALGEFTPGRVDGTAVSVRVQMELELSRDR